MRRAGVEQLLCCHPVRQRHPGLARARQRVVQVFVVQLDPEAWVESAPDHALAMHLQDRRRCARPKTCSVGRTDRVGPHK